MIRTCMICGSEYEITGEQLDYLLKLEMIHPFICCKECSLEEMSKMSDTEVDYIIMELGNPAGRDRMWKGVIAQLRAEGCKSEHMPA